MKWLDAARTRVRLVFDRRSAESRMNQEFRFHIEMETEQLMRAKGLSHHEARRQALVAFGGVEKHTGALRDGRGLAWLGGLSRDFKLSVRTLARYPGVTIVGGLARRGIGLGAAYMDFGDILYPSLPLTRASGSLGPELGYRRTSLRLDRPRLAAWREQLETGSRSAPPIDRASSARSIEQPSPHWERDHAVGVPTGASARAAGRPLHRRRRATPRHRPWCWDTTCGGSASREIQA